MVGVSYHELNSGTKRTERHTTAERKQFLVVCVIGAAVFFNALINAGLFEPVVIRDDGIFPGGKFVYKLVENKDYASTGGLWRKVRSDLKTEDHLEDDFFFDRHLYAVYIDNFGTGNGRYFVGPIVNNSNNDMKQRLIQSNLNTSTKENTFDKQDYKIGELPSVRSLVADFPFTDGFVSALLHNYKVFPAMEKHAKSEFPDLEKVVISITCIREQRMCTHFVPMIKGNSFLMGHPNTKEYVGISGKAFKFNLDNAMRGFKKLLGVD